MTFSSLALWLKRDLIYVGCAISILNQKVLFLLFLEHANSRGQFAGLKRLCRLQLHLFRTLTVFKYQTKLCHVLTHNFQKFDSNWRKSCSRYCKCKAYIFLGLAKINLKSNVYYSYTHCSLHTINLQHCSILFNIYTNQIESMNLSNLYNESET